MIKDNDIKELEELCNWLSHQPCKSAYSADIAKSLPHLQQWTKTDWKSKRKAASLIYYQVTYGWRLCRNWEKRIKKLKEIAHKKSLCG
ncbi:hypothetical protein CSQ79_24495 [Gloeocapsopsis sp. IPPAS B-1203]|nr:hypothetical protein CSQ79_24495 [Gloeocapsopsis sp. IPPAS B-1203]